MHLGGKGARTRDRADVGRNDAEFVVVVNGFIEFGEIVAREERIADHIVNGDVEEALNLRRVEVHRQHAVGAGAGDEVGDELCGDGVAALGLTVLPGVAEIGDDGGDAAGGGAAERVDHDEQLHEVVVNGLAGRLDDENVAAANGFIDGYGNLAVSKSGYGAVAQIQP